MRVFKTKVFARFARRKRITEKEICEAARRAAKGLIDADLGGGVIKQRLARKGQGKSGGFRSIILFQRNEKMFFVYGFAKSDRDNIRKDELIAFRKLADAMFILDNKALVAVTRNGTIMEVRCHEQTISERSPGSRA